MPSRNNAQPESMKKRNSSHILICHLLRPTDTVCSEDTNVDADNRDDNTEKNEDRYFADKSDPNQNGNKHDNEKTCSIDSIVVECTGRR